MTMKTDSHTASSDSHTASSDSHTASSNSHTASSNSHTASSNSHTASSNSHTASSTALRSAAGSNFIALDVSYRLIEALSTIVPAIERQDRDLADQIRRAATSVSLNLAEGSRSLKGNRQKHFFIAHGSANEVKAGLCVAKAWGWVEGSDRALAVLDRLLALLWRLTH
jgi:four helix bundle protein